MYDAIMDGFFGYIGSGEALTCPIYVDDLCAGVLAALDRPESRRPGHPPHRRQKVAWKDYAQRHVRRGRIAGRGRRACRSRSPIAAAWLMTAAARALRKPRGRPSTMYRVEQGSHDYHFSNAKARELLGFEPKVFYEEGLARHGAGLLDARLKRRARLE